MSSSWARDPRSPHQRGHGWRHGWESQLQTIPPQRGIGDQGTTVTQSARNGVTPDGCLICDCDIPRRPAGTGPRTEHPTLPCEAPAAPHHAQVVHEAGAMLPDLGRAAGQRLHADLLAPIELLHRGDHSVDSVKQQGRGQLGAGGRRAGGSSRRPGETEGWV